MNRSLARLFSALLASAVGTAPLTVNAQDAAAPPSFWFAGTRLIFDRPVPLDGDVAVSIHDPGLSRLLTRVGASVSTAPGARSVIVTSADRRIIAFAVGDTRYTVGGVAAAAPFAPFFDGADVIVPLQTLARALGIEPVLSGSETVLEPQVSGLDVRDDGDRTLVALHGAVALHPVMTPGARGRVTIVLRGVGSALAPHRTIGGSVRSVDVNVTGTPKNPTTSVTLTLARGVQGRIVQAPSIDDVDVAVAPASAVSPVAQAPQPVLPAPLARETPAAAPPAADSDPSSDDRVAAPSASPTPPAAANVVRDVAVDARPDGGVDVRVRVDGTPAYSWHRLRDERWYLDLAATALAAPVPDNRPPSTLVNDVRVRQIGTPDAPVVRIAFTTRGEPRIDVTPSGDGLALAVSSAPADLARSGDGRVGDPGASAASGAVSGGDDATVAAGPPQDATLPSDTAAEPWKFAPPAAAPPVPAGSGSRIIVLDPGHGGDDAGTAHNGLMEKRLTLDIAQRLRTLLVRAGWIVKLTRNTDIDPVSPQLLAAFAGDGRPNASDRAYLQTRCDVANAVNARMFISIHINYADAASVRGTTFYYSKPQDVALAQALERVLIPAIGTQDDGVVKSNLYVTKHTTMPAVLIETAFISNPGDVRMLSDPAFLQNVAVGIAAGVKAYAAEQPALSSQADP